MDNFLINKEVLDKLFEQARACERKRMNYDLRTSPNDSSQRMLNALMPGTLVPIHRHPHSNENVLLLCGKLVEVLYEEVENGSESSKGLREKERYQLDPSVGNLGCVVPANTWHTVEVLEPSVIYEAKDGRYGEDGSESYDDFHAKQKQTTSTPDNCIGDLKQQITYLIGMERQSGSMYNCSPLYISRMLNISLAEVETAMKEMEM